MLSDPINGIDPLGLARGGERGATGGSSGQNSKNKYKHCWLDPNDPNFIICKHHQTGKTTRKPKPKDWDEVKNAREICPSSCQDLAAGAAIIGSGYLLYRCIRTLPSLVPPLWWTLPANLATP